MNTLYDSSAKSAISQPRSRPAFITLFPQNVAGPDGLKLMVAVDQIGSVTPYDDGEHALISLKRQIDAQGTPFHRLKVFEVPETFEQIEQTLQGYA